MEAENTMTDLRAASFAVYINTAQDSLVKKLTEQVQCPPSTVIPSEDSQVIPAHPGKVVPKDGEIGVFGAEKYFNTSMDADDSISTTAPRLVDDCTRKLGYKKGNHVDPYYSGSKMRSGTPSVSSESSWGSRTAFLRSIQRNLSISRQSNRTSEHRRFFAGFGCKNCCTDRKSTHVSERGSNHDNVADRSNSAAPLGGSGRKLPSQSSSHSHPRATLLSQGKYRSPSFDKSRSNSKRTEPFTFPVLNNKENAGISSKEVEKVRKSLEVFGSNAKKRADNAVEMNLERKLSMLTWDAIPKAQVLKSPPRMDDDMGSEASSELFEIENATIPPSMCYEPSEASIEWSVVTASAADFSILSEYDEKEVVADTSGRINTPANNNRPNFSITADRREAQSRPSGLLGFKSQKAVQVAESTHKMDDMVRTPWPQPRLEAAAP